jgi:hypothetical protein
MSQSPGKTVMPSVEIRSYSLGTWSVPTLADTFNAFAADEYDAVAQRRRAAAGDEHAAHERQWLVR